MLKPSALMDARSFRHAASEPGPIGEIIGARAVPPLYQTATGKNGSGGAA